MLEKILQQLEACKIPSIFTYGCEAAITLNDVKRILTDAFKTKPEGLEVERMLTVSTAHISEETCEALELDGIRNEIQLPIYSKSTADNGNGFGFYIYILPGQIDWDKIPEDLAPLIRLTMDNNCTVLCLDCDGQELEGFKTYDW